jgi:hypothetical protein
MKSKRFHPLLLICAVLVFLLGAGAVTAKEDGEIVRRILCPGGPTRRKMGCRGQRAG